MAIKRPKPEEIVVKLRQVEVMMGQGMPRVDTIRQISVTGQTYYRWKKKYGGMGIEQLKELKRLQKENERVLGQHRSTQRRLPRGSADEEHLVEDMIELTRQFGRYGYRRVSTLLRDAGWQVNDKRIERLWLNDGSCVRLRPEYHNHVWSYDFVHHRTNDGRAFRTPNILDEYSQECLAIRVNRKLNSTEVINALTDLFIL